jgi:hypothetical protein
MPWETEENHRKIQCQKPVWGLRCEPTTSRRRSRSITQSIDRNVRCPVDMSHFSGLIFTHRLLNISDPCYLNRGISLVKRCWLCFLFFTLIYESKSIHATGCWGPIELWDVEAPTLSRQSAHRWWWGCQPHAPAALQPQEDSWYSFLLEAKSTPRAIVRLEGLVQLRNPLTSSGIEPATFRLVVYCHNQLRYHVSVVYSICSAVVIWNCQFRFQLILSWIVKSVIYKLTLRGSGAGGWGTATCHARSSVLCRLN